MKELTLSRPKLFLMLSGQIINVLFVAFFSYVYSAVMSMEGILSEVVRRGLVVGCSCLVFLWALSALFGLVSAIVYIYDKNNKILFNEKKLIFLGAAEIPLSAINAVYVDKPPRTRYKSPYMYIQVKNNCEINLCRNISGLVLRIDMFFCSEKNRKSKLKINPEAFNVDAAFLFNFIKSNI